VQRRGRKNSAAGLRKATSRLERVATPVRQDATLLRKGPQPPEGEVTHRSGRHPCPHSRPWHIHVPLAPPPPRGATASLLRDSSSGSGKNLSRTGARSLDTCPAEWIEGIE